MSDSIIKLYDVHKYYRTKNEELHILNNVSLEIKRGEFISVMGKSGCGKSTFLNMLGMLDKPDSGEVHFNNKNILHLKKNEIDEIKNKNIGFVFQFHYLLPEFTALENVLMPALISGITKSEAVNRAKEIIEAVGMSHRLSHKPMEMSGGEKQRIAIARALVNSPDIILADEPTGNLDDETSSEIHYLLKKIQNEMNHTILVVTHSHELSSYASMKYVLKNGTLKEVM